MESALALAAASGIAAGLVHLISGADHLAAVLPLAMERRFRGWVVGAKWGIGHGAGVVAVAGLLVLLRERLDLEALGSRGERLVGVMLIAIGLLGLRRALRTRVHAHEHEHDGRRHAHLHLHAADPHPPRQGSGSHAHRHTALAAGLLHGVAGTSHLLGVLPALALGTAGASAAYLGGFALGSAGGMAGFAALVGEGASRLGVRAPGTLRGAMAGASILTVAVGAAWTVL